jgi:hypothetical protein
MVRGTAYARMSCNDQVIKATVHGDPYTDELMAQRLIWAQGVDDGTLSLDQAKLDDAQLRIQIAQERQQGALAQEQANADRTEAAAAVMAATPRYTPPPITPYKIPTYTPPAMPVQTNCMQIGNMTHCASE